MPVRSDMSIRNTFSTVSTTTAAEATRKGSERRKMPAASSATPKASQTAE